MTSRSRSLLYVGAGAGVLVAGILLTFFLSLAVRSGEVLPRVYVGDADLSGLGHDDAVLALGDFEAQLLDTPAQVRVKDTVLTLDPRTVGFQIDIERAVREAEAAGRGSVWQRFTRWIGRSSDRLSLPASLDPEATGLVVEQWQAEAITDPPFEGSITWTDTGLEVLYPRTGEGLDPEQVAPLLIPVLSMETGRPVVEIPIITVDPELTTEALDLARSEAEQLVAAPITLDSADGEVQVTFDPAELGPALRTRLVVNSPARLVVDLDPETIAPLLAEAQSKLEAPPEDARIEITAADDVEIIPGKPGTLIDPAVVAAQIMAAASAPDRSGDLPVVDGAEPDFTTADAEALGIKEKVSEFTTKHPCCAPRVTNIHRMADMVDGAIVMPGDTFSLNEYVGPRTEEKGFVPAPMILRGEYVDSVGGGVSQFATTIYNAVFFGGYEDVQHSPHSYYISRYPEGREATVSWPAPELIFRNDSDAAILIKTSYTDTSITVKFFGDNGGREVEAGLSSRSNYRNPETQYEANAALGVDDQKVVQQGGQGWDVTVTRTITYPDGEIATQTWPVRYRAEPTIIQVHPCKVPGATVACPTTTTSSTTTTVAPPPDSSTTTVAPSTTAPPTTTATTTTTAPATTTTAAPGG